MTMIRDHRSGSTGCLYVILETVLVNDFLIYSELYKTPFLQVNT